MQPHAERFANAAGKHVCGICCVCEDLPAALPRRMVQTERDEKKQPSGHKRMQFTKVMEKTLSTVKNVLHFNFELEVFEFIPTTVMLSPNTNHHKFVLLSNVVGATIMYHGRYIRFFTVLFDKMCNIWVWGRLR